ARRCSSRRGDDAVTPAFIILALLFISSVVAGVEFIAQRKRARVWHAEITFQHRLLDAVEQGLVALDAEGRVSYANNYAQTLYGWQRADLLGQPIVDRLLPERAREQGRRAIARVLAGESW